MELLIPSIYRRLDMIYYPEEIERTTVTVIMDNLSFYYPRVNFAELYFKDSDTYDRYVYTITIDKIVIDTKEYKFDKEVRITVSNNRHRRFTNDVKKIVFNLKPQFFRNEEGTMIKYYDYNFIT